MKRLRKLTRAVLRNNRVRTRRAKKPAQLDAIRHVIYVIKENRTYDQVLGNLGKGDGDPGLTLFNDDSAPNHRELARRFTLFDNFFADADVSADGLSWTISAGVSDYVDKTWPITYSPGARRRHRARDFEHVDFAEQFLTEPLAFDRTIFRGAAALTRGYLWDNAYNAASRSATTACTPASRATARAPATRRRSPTSTTAASATTSTSTTRASTWTAPTTPFASPSGRASSPATRRSTAPIPPRTRCPRSRSCGSRTTTPTARPRARRSRRATSPTTTSRSGASSRRSRRARSGPTPRSS